MWGEPLRPHRHRRRVQISTHSPRVGRTSLPPPPIINSVNFNSLAPCGANRSTLMSFGRTLKFQLTRPVWGEPRKCMCSRSDCLISTHSPRVGRTDHLRGVHAFTFNFNSLAPCGANLGALMRVNRALDISTHSPRVGRTPKRLSTTRTTEISTHSPRVGRTTAIVGTR